MDVPEPRGGGPVHPGACCRMTQTSQPSFPAIPYTVGSSYFEDYMEEMVQAWKTIEFAEFDRAATILTVAYLRRAAVYSCGNGGSASIANHLVCDHTKGVRNKTDLAPRI